MYEKQLSISSFVSKSPILRKVSVHISFGLPKIISGGTVDVVMYALEKKILYLSIDSIDLRICDVGR